VILLKVFLGTVDATTTSESKAQHIGGNAGLTTGISMMTVFEWLEFLFTALGIYVVAGKARQYCAHSREPERRARDQHGAIWNARHRGVD